MRGTVDPNLLLFDPEIEKTSRQNKAKRRKKETSTSTMGEVPAEILERIRRETEERLRAEYTRTDAARLQEALLRATQEREQDEANRSLRDLTAPAMSYDYPGSIAPRGLAVNNFESRPAFINLVSQHQYGGSVTEDPHAHLERFIRNCNTMRLNNVSNEVIRLELFPFSLRDIGRASCRERV